MAFANISFTNPTATVNVGNTFLTTFANGNSNIIVAAANTGNSISISLGIDYTEEIINVARSLVSLNTALSNTSSVLTRLADSSESTNNSLGTINNSLGTINNTLTASNGILSNIASSLFIIATNSTIATGYLGVIKEDITKIREDIRILRIRGETQSLGIFTRGAEDFFNFNQQRALIVSSLVTNPPALEAFKNEVLNPTRLPGD